jgi:D-ribose pyranose/furanose isomerase RbsD
MIEDGNTRACVRSAEFTSYSSVVLQAGVTYGGEMSAF